MTAYGQFCPVAKAMELLDERWTMLVIRELLCGSRHFNALRRGVPRMSPTLLSARLRTLERAGIVDRYDGGRQVTYELTPAGEQLRPIVEAARAVGPPVDARAGRPGLRPAPADVGYATHGRPGRRPSGPHGAALPLDRRGPRGPQLVAGPL
jgi:DNA-binding HxlR family transcriptional regulator